MFWSWFKHFVILGVVYFSDAIGSEDELNAAILEEKEALALQKKMAQDLDEEDFGLEMFAVSVKNNQEQLVKQGCLLVRLKFVHLSNLQLTVLCSSFTCFLILIKPCNSWEKSRPKRLVELKIYSNSSIIISLTSVIYSQIWHNKNKIWHVKKGIPVTQLNESNTFNLDMCQSTQHDYIYIAFTQLSLIYLFNMPPVTYFFVNNFAEYITFLKIFSFNFA